jgi:urease accessory protein UreH
VLGYGGGLISGDVIELNIKVKKNAKLLVTSLSTSKAFKAISGRKSTVLRTNAKIGKGGLLFLAPQPLQCFGNSVLTKETHIILEGGLDSRNEKDDPSLLLVDWYTGGRKNLDGGLWQLDSFHTTTTVSYSTSRSLFVQTDESIEEDGNAISGVSCEQVFQDATRLSGGKGLKHRMRDYNIICMVVLMGPKVKEVASTFMQQYASGRTYDDGGQDHSFGTNPLKKMDFNTGEDMYRVVDEGPHVSCGTFHSCKEGRCRQEGVVVRIAATTLDVVGKSKAHMSIQHYYWMYRSNRLIIHFSLMRGIANFLSKHIGTLDGQLSHDPFL